MARRIECGCGQGFVRTINRSVAIVQSDSTAITAGMRRMTLPRARRTPPPPLLPSPSVGEVHAPGYIPLDGGGLLRAALAVGYGTING